MKMQSIKRYEAYKDSGVEWLGEVPAHWLEQRVKDIALLERGKFTHRPRNDPQMYDGEHPFIQTGDVARANKYVNNYKQTLSDKGTEVSKKFKKGTLLMAIAANIGDVAILGFDSYLPDSVIGYKPKKTDTDYLFYLFMATKNELNRVKITSTQDNLNLERLNSLIKFVPPFPEQQAIAAYLDTKTAQIDRKIDLLSQKAAQYGKLKQSLINETVTRGLDKSVPMKDSGVEWIGEVPAHWEVKRVKELFDISRGRVIAQTELLDEGQFPVYSSQTKDDGCLGYINTFDYDGTYITWTTDGVNAGTVFLRRGKFNCTNICGTLKLKNKKCDIAYLFYSLQLSTKHNKRIDTNGAKIMSNEMMFIKICVPLIDEQQAIANYLDEKTAHIDRIVATINSQIDKLKELRKTLINDVVTGKIKVA
jgi:type I restriction enzyme S subunit